MLACLACLAFLAFLAFLECDFGNRRERGEIGGAGVVLGWCWGGAGVVLVWCWGGMTKRCEFGRIGMFSVLLAS